MKQARIFIILAIVAFLAAPASAGFFKKSKIDKGIALASAKMYTEAERVLREAVVEEATSKEVGKAHYQLAVIYLHKRNLPGALARFESAIALGEITKQTAGEKLLWTGDIYLHKGFASKAIDAYHQALAYGVGSKTEIAEKAFQKGVFFLDPRRRCSASADHLFNFATRLDPAKTQAVQKAQVDYGQKLLQLAKENPRQKKTYLAEAEKYLSQKEIETVFPPPTWKIVYKNTFIGQGESGGDDKKYNDGGIWTAKYEENVKKGDRFTVVNSDFEVWIKGDWHEYPKGHRLNVTQMGEGYVTFRLPKGKKFTVIVERLEA